MTERVFPSLPSTMFVQLLTTVAVAIPYVLAQNATNVTIQSVTQAFQVAKIVPDGEHRYVS